MATAHIIVSSCLIGKKCAYDGRARLSEKVLALCQKHGYVDVCPELLGGLGCPREIHEICGGRVLSKDGIDRTKEFYAGADRALQEALQSGARVAVLKSRSPSCGKGTIYDGTFSGNLVPGNGVTAELFLKKNIKVFSEDEIEEIRRELQSS